MIGRRLLGIGVLALIAAGIVTWRVWPRNLGPAVPPVTAGELRQFDRGRQGHLTLLDGGSKSEAQRLWADYHDRPAYQG